MSYFSYKTHSFRCDGCGKTRDLTWSDEGVKNKREAIQVMKGGWYGWQVNKDGTCFCYLCREDKEEAKND